MAESEGEIEFTISWENGDFFQMTEKKDGGEKKTVVKIEENGHIASVWESVADMCSLVFRAQIDEIGDEMKKPSA